MKVRVAVQRKMCELFEWYCGHPDELPQSFRSRAVDHGVRRSVADYIAGMTDRFLEQDYARRL
jgi:dGTPase